MDGSGRGTIAYGVVVVTASCLLVANIVYLAWALGLRLDSSQA